MKKIVLLSMISIGSACAMNQQQTDFQVKLALIQANRNNQPVNPQIAFNASPTMKVAVAQHNQQCNKR